ncbi:uncharacterized protein [Rutidosis leptorrhynchoides]|uniref:uncharacterized protein n=1 Tax=Rutidosis leptorrhynchoides TaxID=125765 RepID=UPI003A9910C3
MKLKPSKCSFGKEEGSFLGHVITTRGIKDNPKKIEAIECMPSLKTKKQVQSLSEKLATLTRFLSRAAERSLPFFSTLKNCEKKSDFKWTDEAEKAFQEMKALLKNLPTLTAPITGEAFILYLAIVQEAVSSVLIAEREGNYCTTAAVILPSSPHRGIDGSAYSTNPVSIRNVRAINEMGNRYIDGTSGPQGAGAGLLLTGPDKEEHTYTLRFNFKATKNEAEYEALLAGLILAKEIEVKRLQIYVDSQLFAKQINDTFDVHDEGMQAYLALARSFISEFDEFHISKIPRSQNKQADVLCKLAALAFYHLEKKILVEQIFKKSIEPDQLAAVVEHDEHCWMTDIIEFLKIGTLPKDDKEAKKIRVK